MYVRLYLQTAILDVGPKIGPEFSSKQWAARRQSRASARSPHSWSHTPGSRAKIREESSDTLLVVHRKPLVVCV